MTPEENREVAKATLQSVAVNFEIGDPLTFADRMTLAVEAAIAQALAAREAATVERCAKVVHTFMPACSECGKQMIQDDDAYFCEPCQLLDESLIGAERDFLASALRATLKPETKGEGTP